MELTELTVMLDKMQHLPAPLVLNKYAVTATLEKLGYEVDIHTRHVTKNGSYFGQLPQYLVCEWILSPFMPFMMSDSGACFIQLILKGLTA